MRLNGLIFALCVALATVGCEPPVTPPADADGGVDVVDSTDPEDTDADAVVDPPVARVVTFNVRRLFDRTCDSGRCGPDDFEEVPSEQEYDLQLQRTADAIVQMQPDVVLLQEIENELVLDDLRSRMPSEYNVSVIGETGFAASLDVAVISRGELIETQGYRDSRPLELPGGGQSEFTREFLQVNVELEGEEVIAFVAHFKSKSNDDPERRLAEAQEARDIVEGVASANPDAMVVFGGDLNDTPGSDPLDALVSNGGLERAGDEKSNDQMWTFSFRGDLQAIDHILVAPTEGGAYVESSATVVRDRNGGGLADSDHAALHADFALY